MNETIHDFDKEFYKTNKIIILCGLIFRQIENDADGKRQLT